MRKTLTEASPTTKMRSCPQCSATYPDDYAVCPKDGAALKDTSLWQTDTVIRGRYKILARIGEGGMATVFKAHHQLLDELRALKVIKVDLARDELFVQRFKNEAIITRKLQHPNAVRVDDLDIAEDGRPFISMEFVEGESLKSMILRTGAVGVSQTLDIALQVCQALDAAHALGLIHRDIKPDNIFLVPRCEGSPLAKVLDFGIARLKETTPGQKLGGMTLTGTGVVIGTPEYMSPEQAMGKHGDALDARSDLYSLGIVMYRMLTGELPFKADTTVEMILHHIQTVPKPPQALKPQLSIPESVSSLVMKALEKDREKRFASASTMADAIRQAQARSTSAGRVASAVASAASPAIGAAPVAAAPPAQPPQPPVPNRAGAVREMPLQSAARLPATSASQPTPAKPAFTWPAPPAPTKKGFPTVPALVGIVTVVLLVLAVAHRRRLETSPVEPAPAPQVAQATQAPATAPPQTSASSAAAPQTESRPPSSASRSDVTPNQAPSVAEGWQPTAGPAGKPPKAPGSAATIARPPEETPPAPALGLTDNPPPSGETRQPSPPPRDYQPQPSPGRAPQQGSNQPGNFQRPLNPSGGNQPAGGPQQMPPALQYGQQFLQAGEYGKAAMAFRRALDANPNNRLAQLGLQKSLGRLGQQFFEGGQYGRAAQMYRQILEVNPNDRGAQQRLEACQQKMREKRQGGGPRF